MQKGWLALCMQSQDPSLQAASAWSHFVFARKSSYGCRVTEHRRLEHPHQSMLTVHSKHAGAGLPVTMVEALATAKRPACTKEVVIQPVLTGLVADYIMRCHLTHWYGPTANHPGGWCMCVRRLDGQIVGGYAKKTRQPYLGNRMAFAGDSRLHLTDSQLVAKGVEAERISDALRQPRAQTTTSCAMVQCACEEIGLKAAVPIEVLIRVE
jgi:hypothetical protein